MVENMKIVALIPAYNEEKTVASVINKTLKYVDEVIFVNDGSVDNTLDAVKKLRNKRVKILSHYPNRGKGFALRKGFKEFLKSGKKGVIVTIDADGQNDPSQIPMLSVLIEKNLCDVVVGSRYTKIETAYPRVRVLFNIISNFVMLLTAGGFFADVASGFRAYSREAVKKILPWLGLDGYGIELEILKFCAEERLRLATVPVTCDYAVGRKQNFKKIAKEYFKFAWKYKSDIFRRLLK